MRPLRAALFAPGSKDRVMAKALESGADAVIFDLEDSVPVAAKSAARGLVANAIDAAAGSRGPLVTVRVNAASTGLLNDDLRAVVRTGLGAIFLPKAETAQEVLDVSSALSALEKAADLREGAVEIVLMIESALGVYRCFELLSCSPRVATVCIGSAKDGDLQADLGCGWSIEGPEMLYSKSKVLLDARAAGKSCPLDGVFADLGDEAALVRDSQLSARIGYMGRTVIHPRQIEPVRRAYAVAADQVAYYTRVVTEFAAAEKAGVAAITVDGKLVDYAMYQRAKRVLELVELDGRPSGSSSS